MQQGAQNSASSSTQASCEQRQQGRAPAGALQALSQTSQQPDLHTNSKRRLSPATSVLSQNMHTMSQPVVLSGHSKHTHTHQQHQRSHRASITASMRQRRHQSCTATTATPTQLVKQELASSSPHAVGVQHTKMIHRGLWGGTAQQAQQHAAQGGCRCCTLRRAQRRVAACLSHGSARHGQNLCRNHKLC